MKDQGVRPNVVAYASLAKPFAHTGDWQEVEKIAGEMRAQGLRMNDYFLYALLLAYANGRPRQDARAEKALREAVAGGVKANRYILNALARALGRPRAQDLM